MQPITLSIPRAAAEQVGLAYDCEDTGDGVVTKCGKRSVKVTAHRGFFVRLAASLDSLDLGKVAKTVRAKAVAA